MSFHRVLAFGLTLALTAPAAPGADGLRLPPGKDFGQGIQHDELTSFKKAVRNPEKFEGRTIVLRAPVRQVCQKKGCWMVLGKRDYPVRVRFHDYSFFVPKDSAGATAYVQGTLKRVTIPESVARHYAEDAGKDPSTIRGDQEGLEFMATGVRLVDAPAQTRPQTRSRD